MKCNRDPHMNYFGINYCGWRLYCFSQNRGKVGEKMEKKNALRFIISPWGCFFVILTLKNSKHSLRPNIKKTTCPEG